jgi:hypothetical protein
VICPNCRGRRLPDSPPLKDIVVVNHTACPEVARRNSDLSAIELAGGSWCDCQHVPRIRSVPDEGSHPTLNT